MFEGIKTAAKVAGLMIKANSPAILLVGGIGLGVATVVTAVAKSEEAVEVMDELNERLNTIQMAEENNIDFTTVNAGDTPLESAKQARLMVRLYALKKFAKVYAVPAMLGVASIACFLGSFGILNKQKAALAGAYALLESKFGTYRGRVVEKFGQQADYDIMTGTKEVYSKEIVDGKEVEVVTKERSSVLTDWTARVWDETTSYHWDRNFLVRKNNLLIAKNHANDIFKARGYITLNEVYRIFGLEESDVGVSAGWVKGFGDDEIECGIEEEFMEIEEVRRFMNPYEGEVPEEGVVLRFNCLADIRPALIEYNKTKNLDRRAARLTQRKGVATC